MVRGAIQGVGFRPHVHRLASDLGLSGWVSNDPEACASKSKGPRWLLPQSPLLESVVCRLTEQGYSVCWHRHVPTGGGGIALGQIVAAVGKGVKHVSGGAGKADRNS